MYQKQSNVFKKVQRFCFFSDNNTTVEDIKEVLFWPPRLKTIIGQSEK